MSDRVTEPPLRFTVPEDMAGKRFDVVLAALAPEYSRARLQRWIRDGRATVEQRTRRPRDPVEAGDLIELDAPAQIPTPAPFPPQCIDLTIRHEDDAVIVIDKPAGMVVHPGAGRPDGTLVNALLHHEPRLAAIPRAGLVHRLDKDTTGLLVVARTLAAHKSLVDQLAARTIGREYLAVVRGRVIAGGTIDEPVGRHSGHRTRMAVVRSGGRRAITHYRVETRFRAHTALAVRLDTGRTHQIRVHLAHRGFPVVGDPDYGRRAVTSAGASPALETVLRRFTRQALHARRLTLRHPITGEDREWTAPPPDDLKALLAALAGDAAPDRGNRTETA
ncbi:MAG: 23S rRNA pseudouridine(1911/1915/1917) synthase RluD [Immundisolibacterales bacterium]|nr:23S rRNA pseudouridine(1911/1915/1917) synthase RluD [Immundisolibacterales bacterium]